MSISDFVNNLPYESQLHYCIEKCEEKLKAIKDASKFTVWEFVTDRYVLRRFLSFPEAVDFAVAWSKTVENLPDRDKVFEITTTKFSESEMANFEDCE